ncbi:HAMP domain-containing protein [Paenibacillus sp. FSL R10-2736]|uniref:HAMP domain-containing protein n=1 Tax=Paenibacillus sp. FSL R10-2736 TaxID=2954692 RepID=UPI004046AB45
MARGDLAEAARILNARPVRSRDEIGTAYRAMLQMSGDLNARVTVCRLGGGCCNCGRHG